MTLLEKAISLATYAHENQLYGFGESATPKIVHALEVMFKVRETFPLPDLGDYTLEEMMVAAVLHDVVEDGGILLSYVELEFGARVAQVVDGVTRRKGETYREFILRAKSFGPSAVLKLADLNVNLSHNHELPEDKKSLRFRYLAAIEVILLGTSWEEASRRKLCPLISSCICLRPLV